MLTNAHSCPITMDSFRLPTQTQGASMKRIVVLVGLSCMAIALCAAQNATAPAASNDSAASSPAQIHGAFPVTLDKGLDSKKAKVGDPVVCKMALGLRSRNGLNIPAGSKVMGHVTQAEAKSKGGSDSSLGIAFDKIEANGQQIPIKGVLQAVGPSVVDHSGPDTGAGASGGVGMGGNSTGGSAGTTAGPQSWNAGNPNAGGSVKMLNAQSQGVVGLKGLELGKDSVITSSGKEVKLDSGTQFMVRAENEEPAQ